MIMLQVPHLAFFILERRAAVGLRGWLAMGLCAMAAHAGAIDLKVAAPNAVKESITEIAARYETESGNRVQFTRGGSESIAKRVADGDMFDVVINTAQAVDRMLADGKLLRGSLTDFSRSAVAVAIRLGSKRPDVSTVEGLKAALLSAPSIAISSGASGRYLEQVFQRLGVAEQIKHKIKQPPSGTQISDMLASGEADLGFQQVQELLHARGIDYLGLLPAELQNYTVWSAGVHSLTSQPDEARTFIRAMKAMESRQAIRKTGMDPL